MERRASELRSKRLVWLRENAKKGNKDAINELILRAKDGDKDAMAEIIELYEGLIHKHASRFFLNGYALEDLEQIARCVVIESVHKFDGDFGSDFIFFVSTNVKNKLGTIGRKKDNNENFSSLEEPTRSGVIIKDTLEDKVSIEDEYIEKERIRALIKVLGSLPKSDREFILYVHKDRGNLQKYYEEHRDEMTYGKVRHRKDSLLKKIREAMKDYK